MATPPPPTWQDIAVKCGLGKPSARCFVAGVTVASVLYFAGQPRSAFTEEGKVRPFTPLSPGPDGTYNHFLVAPLAAATAVYLFT